MVDISWITEYGTWGLISAVAMALIFIFFKWGLPALKDLKSTFSAGHVDTVKLIKSVDEKVSQLIENDVKQNHYIRELQGDSLKRLIMDTEIPYPERVWAAHRYLRYGFNGVIKDHIESSLRSEFPHTFDSVWAIADKQTEVMSI